MNVPGKKNPETANRKRWEPPTVTNAGSVAEVVAGGNGKTSTSFEDSGDDRKPPGKS